jgi:hypothetical protein
MAPQSLVSHHLHILTVAYSRAHATLDTILTIPPGELYSKVLDLPLITNAALSTSAASIIAHQEVDKYTSLFGYNWWAYLPGILHGTVAQADLRSQAAKSGRRIRPRSHNPEPRLQERSGQSGGSWEAAIASVLLPRCRGLVRTSFIFIRSV